MTGEQVPDTGWQRCLIDKEVLRRFTRKGDPKGLVQVFSLIALAVPTGAAAFSAWRNFPPHAFPLLLFLRLFSLFGCNNDLHNKRSHLRHHLHILRPPGDFEVVLPIGLKGEWGCALPAGSWRSGDTRSSSWAVPPNEACTSRRDRSP